MISGMALLQPLQQDLFALESDAEVLLSLRESARILFDLNRVAFLLCDQGENKLSAGSIGGQPTIFRQVDVPLSGNGSLVTRAALQREICSSFDTGETAQVSLIDIQFARAFNSPGLLCIPMIARKSVFGVMICGLSQSQHARLSRRLPWLMNFGRIAAISLEFQGRSSKPAMPRRQLNHLARLALQEEWPFTLESFVLYTDEYAGANDTGHHQIKRRDGNCGCQFSSL